MSDPIERSIRVLPFKGGKTEWRMWSRKFLARARAKGFKAIMEGTPGTTAVPKYNEVLDETQDADKPKIKARKANDDGYNELLLSIEDEVCFGLVDGAVTPDLPDGDLAKAWTALKNKFEPKTKTAMTDLKLDFTKCKMEEGEDPEEWITTLESYQWRLLKDFN
eukprot:scaffold22134_cov95-Amphora_coffeaeformis.AAC.1